MVASGPQREVWDKEYRNPRLLSLSNVPNADVVRFLKYLKKKWREDEVATGTERVRVENLSVLDVGSGTGCNAYYFAERGSTVIGYEISPTAVSIARGFADKAGLPIAYEERDIGAPYPLENESIDLVLDATSSNSLSNDGREIYLKECARVLKPGGRMFVRALCKDGDSHAKTLIAAHAGLEKDTYILPEVGVAERAFSKADFISTYSPYFELESLEKTTYYARMSGRVFKRSYWVAYLRKPRSNSSQDIS